MPSSAWITIAATTLSNVVRREGIGELPLLLRPEPTWASDDEQLQADIVAQAELRRLGWVDQRGRVDLDVLDNLQLLGHPLIEYGALFQLDGLRYGVAITAVGDNAVLARSDGSMIQLAFLRDQFLPGILLRQLPEVSPATVPAVNVRRADVSATDTFGHDGRALRQITEQELLSAGELYVSARDRYGRHRVSPVIRYLDYPIGRVLVVVSHDYLSIAPASRELLLARLGEACAAVAA